MNTTEKINYLEKLLKSKGCSDSNVMPYVMQIINHCNKNNKCVTEIELI